MPVFKLQNLSTAELYAAIVLQRSSAVLFFQLEDAPYEADVTVSVPAIIPYFEAVIPDSIKVALPVLSFVVDTDPSICSLLLPATTPRVKFWLSVPTCNYMWIKPKVRPSVKFKVDVPVVALVSIPPLKPAIKLFLFRAIDIGVRIRRKIGRISFNTEFPVYAELSIRAPMAVVDINSYSPARVRISIGCKPLIFFHVIDTTPVLSILSLTTATPSVSIFADQVENAVISILTKPQMVMFRVGSPNFSRFRINHPRNSLLFLVDNFEAVAMTVSKNAIIKFCIDSTAKEANISLQLGTIVILLQVSVDNEEEAGGCEIIKHRYVDNQLKNEDSLDPEVSDEVISFSR